MMGKLNSAGMLIFYSLNLDVNALFFFLLGMYRYLHLILKYKKNCISGLINLIVIIYVISEGLYIKFLYF
jgi:hypothetical protein